ncbi:hypothetical protein Hanom_Chr01g00001341 [Helianthus anomalus]
MATPPSLDSSSSNAILCTSVMNSDPNYVLYLQSMIIFNFLIEENRSGYCVTLIVSGIGR